MSNKKLIVFLIISMAIWGGSWTSGKLLSISAPFEVVIFWRFFITTLSMIPLFRFFKVSIRVPIKELLLLLLGGFTIFLYNIGFIAGLQTGFAGAGGVLVTGLTPIITFLLTILILREKASYKQILALILGFSGGLIMLEIWNASSSQVLDRGNMLFLFAAFMWAFLTLLSSRIQRTVHFIVYGFYIYLFCTVFSLALTLFNHSLGQTPMAFPFWMNMIYLSIGATTIATTIYFLCTKQLGSRLASSFIFTVPVSALFFSWLILGEIPRLTTLIGGSLTITAVYLINRKKA
ncbi:MAG: DMT family transporter [Spirochaetaceae bacterium]|nr:DMT family transporter [Spirochaetaceae bacterium]